VTYRPNIYLIWQYLQTPLYDIDSGRKRGWRGIPVCGIPIHTSSECKQTSDRHKQTTFDWWSCPNIDVLWRKNWEISFGYVLFSVKHCFGRVILVVVALQHIDQKAWEHSPQTNSSGLSTKAGHWWSHARWARTMLVGLSLFYVTILSQHNLMQHLSLHKDELPRLYSHFYWISITIWIIQYFVSTVWIKHDGLSKGRLAFYTNFSFFS
jgi:hypothetical protein